MRAALALAAVLVGCAVARAPTPTTPALCVAVGQAHAQVGSPDGAFPRAPSCKADGGAISSTMELLLAGVVTTLGSLALAGVF